jgi:hypothetical protein
MMRSGEQEQAVNMNQYERRNAADKVEGYYMPSARGEAPATVFGRAREECLTHLRRQLACVEALTHDEFAELTGRRP